MKVSELSSFVNIAPIIGHSMRCSIPTPGKQRNSKKFAKIGLSTTRGGGFNPNFCFAPQIFSGAQALRAKPRKHMTTPKGRGFISYTKLTMLINLLISSIFLTACSFSPVCISIALRFFCCY